MRGKGTRALSVPRVFEMQEMTTEKKKKSHYFT